MVLGLMLLGLATPTEAAASGVVGTLMVIAIFGKLKPRVIQDSMVGTLKITIMIFMIVAASNTFSAVLAYSGATHGLLGMVKDLDLPPLMVLIGMQLLVFLLGMFMETISIMMICMPIVKLLGFDPVWFGVIMLINFEMGLITPPFGMLLFVMKGVAPKGITIEQICWAAIPFILCDAVAMALLIAFPALALWLPSLL
jgi:TRAP-type mannitol/chloroaromatic compound transport system permease large subunit